MTVTRASAYRHMSATSGSVRTSNPHSRARARRDLIMRWILLLSVGFAIVPLVAILFVTVSKGFGAVDLSFFTGNPPFNPSHEGGGYLAAIVGSIYMTAIAVVLSVPLGIFAAVFLVEYSKSRLAPLVRFFTDVMTGVPSIFVGLFVFSALVVDADLFFGTLPGAVALAVLMLPIVVRSSEEVLRLVPQDLRSGAFGLGARQWQSTMKVVLPAAAPGLATSSMLAVARGMGETAPLLFTALGARQVVLALTGVPQGALPLQILDEGRLGVEAAVQRAWAGSLTLMAMVLIFTIVARYVARRTQLDEES